MWRHIGALLVLLMSCAGCAILDGARSINKRHYLTKSLHELQAKASKEYHHPDSLHSLHPITTRYRSEGEQLLLLALELRDTTQILSVAQLLGRGDLLYHYSTPDDTATRAEAGLLIGNYGEALRLATSGTPLPDETGAMCHLLSGDTLRAKPLLDQVARRGPQELRLPALRVLLHLYPTESAYLNRLYRLTDIPEERLYLEVLQLGAQDPSETTLRTKAHRLLATSHTSPLWSATAELLSPLLCRHDLFVELYDLQSALTGIHPTPSPYRILLDYPLEIAQLRAYESGDRATEPTTSARSFRERYGHITRSPNWAMTYSKNSDSQTLPTPSPELYRHLKERLRRLLQ